MSPRKRKSNLTARPILTATTAGARKKGPALSGEAFRRFRVSANTEQVTAHSWLSPFTRDSGKT
jgi:hypothetical protein